VIGGARVPGALLALCCCLSGGRALGQTADIGVPAPAPASPGFLLAGLRLHPPAALTKGEPRVSLSRAGGVQNMPLPQPVPLVPQAPSNDSGTVFTRWWFWTAMGALVLGTALLLVVGAGDGGVPATRFGNQEAFK
jgi:hypothetical protein